VIFFDLDETLVDDKAATVAGIVALRRFRSETVDDSGFLDQGLLLSDTMFQRYLDGVPEYQSHVYRIRKRIQSIWPELTDSAAMESLTRCRLSLAPQEYVERQPNDRDDQIQQD
jgi:hypothetical protein